MNAPVRLVWLLYAGEYDSRGIVGVFTTEERARDAAREWREHAEPRSRAFEVLEIETEEIEGDPAEIGEHVHEWRGGPSGWRTCASCEVSRRTGDRWDR